MSWDYPSAKFVILACVTLTNTRITDGLTDEPTITDSTFIAMLSWCIVKVRECKI